MSRINPFQIKVSRALGDLSAKKPEAEVSMGELTDDKAMVAGFSFALENILSGKITATEQLAGLVAPRFYNGNLDGGSKDINFSDGNPIRQSAVGDARLRQSDIPTLEKVIKAIKEKNSLRASISSKSVVS